MGDIIKINSKNGHNVEVRISTITMSVQVVSDENVSLNLTNIGKYLDIDNEIIGIKYNYATLNVIKGAYTTSLVKKTKNSNHMGTQNLFYNQVTIIYNNNGNHVNVKLFGNGTLHLTGCKSIKEGETIASLLFEKLKKLSNKEDILLLTRDVNNVWLDKDNLIYSHNHLKVIGFYHKEQNCYVIHKKEYDFDQKTGLFIYRKTESQRKRHLLDMNGEKCGTFKIELVKNKSKFYKRNSNIFYDYQNLLIYYNNDMIIGKMIYDISISNDECTSSETVIETKYKTDAFDKLGHYTFSTDINCINVYFNIGFKINRQKMFQKLLTDGFICKYKPESYSGIKMIYKMSAHLGKRADCGNGLCHCTTKCTCTNITFLIFQSGNVIVTGFKDANQLRTITQFFVDLCDMYENDIKTRLLC